MESSTIKKPLRFGCPACGIRLVVDQSVAGTEGPCPSCGARIVAPPIEAHTSLTEKTASPVAVKPRAAGRAKEIIPIGLDSETSPIGEPEPVSKESTRPRAVNPTTSVSHRHEEQKNTLVFLKILGAVLVVAIIALGASYFLKNS